MQIKQTKSFERELKKLVKKHFPITVLKPCLEAIVEQDVLVFNNSITHSNPPPLSLPSYYTIIFDF